MQRSCRENFHGGNVVTAQVPRQNKDSITIKVTLPLIGSMLQGEESIQDALNEGGLDAPETVTWGTPGRLKRPAVDSRSGLRIARKPLRYVQEKQKPGSLTAAG